ncbi:hypothetical protein ABL78_2585 [Leptomonas seymouri]|uniref:Ankyrin repeat protein n=1 Tax=Leptomonas seymouri TaxID=5684 RepID=A0A0N0P736_LEPSE|nr:hypothetical protein ABL78_2585 [Leptomonas seymouri]|eukprot:KPI88346.1 hypothetical protein ABL78_2585 [Leptomonas seymouri]
MSWPKDPFISDGAYKTPLPSQPCERDVWRAVVRLYEYNTLTALMKAHDGATKVAPTPPARSPAPLLSGDQLTAAPDALRADANILSPIGSPRSITSREEVVARRGAFLAAASAVSSHSSISSVGSSSMASPLSAQAIGQAQIDSLATAASTTTTAISISGSATPSVTVVPPAASLSQPNSPYAARGSSGSRRKSDAMGWTTGSICAATLRALGPLQCLLLECAEKQWTMNAGVVDVAVQHPLPCLRIELVRLLLTYPLWDWSMCAPVTVATGSGDIELLRILLEVKELDPNTGFPLVVAVRRRQEVVLPLLLSHHRIRPNYGGAFYAAVVMGNVQAMHMLGDAAAVNVNRFASNEGTSALLYSLRQLLNCRRWELEQAQLEPLPSTPPVYPMKPHQSVTTLARIATNESKEEEKITATPLPVVHSGGSGSTTVGVSPLRGDGGGGADGKRRSSLPAHTSLGCRRDSPLLARGVAVTAAGWEEEDEQRSGRGRRVPSSGAAAAAASSGLEGAVMVETTALSVAAEGTQAGALRKDTKEQPMQTARHWLEVLLYLLDHPAIEVNAGFYMTPLQMCVLAGDADLVSLLLQHPHLHPNRVPKATTAFRNSYYLQKYQTLSQLTMQCVVVPPFEMASQLHHLDIFRLLARDQRIRVPVQLTLDLERSAADSLAIAFLTILAQYREEWEGWGWRWRRRCLLIAATSTTVSALCYWAVLFFWHSTLHGCLLVLTSTYAISTFVSVLLYLWEVHRLRHTTEESFTHGDTTLLALVRHLHPAWSSLQHHLAVLTLLACPGMLPLLDVLCAWCMRSIYRSRRSLQTVSSSSADGAAVTPTAATASGSTHAGQHHHQHSPYYRSQPAGELLSEMERLSSTQSWGQGIGISNTSGLSDNNSLSEVSHGVTTGDLKMCASNASVSHPRPVGARARWQSAFGGSNHATAREGANAQGADLYDASIPSTPDGGRRQISFGASSSTGKGDAGTTVSPSLCTSRSYGPWVVPGRPSRYVVTTEYRVPDLLLRALLYSSFDRVLTLPRLLTCVVGIFMFMYMVFPSAAPSPSSHSSLVHSTTAAIRGHSSFTLYYGVSPSLITLAQPTAYSLGGAAGLEAASSSDLPAYTVGMGFIGLCGLLSSVIGGGAMLAMMGSLRTVTVQAFFVGPNDKADAKDGNSRVAGRPAGNRDWQAARHHTRETQLDYAL